MPIKKKKGLVASLVTENITHIESSESRLTADSHFLYYQEKENKLSAEWQNGRNESSPVLSAALSRAGPPGQNCHNH